MAGRARRMAFSTWPVLAVPLISAALRRPDTGTAFCAGSYPLTLRRPVLSGCVAHGPGRDPAPRASFRQLEGGAPQLAMLRGAPAVHLPMLGLRGGDVSCRCSSTAAETRVVEAVCYARSVEGEAQTSLVLDLGGRERTLTRLQEDPLAATLDRLLRIASEAERKEQGWVVRSKKGKKVKGKGKKRLAAAAAVADGKEDVDSVEPDAPDPAAGWTAVLEGPSGAPVEDDVINDDAWATGCVLRVGGLAFRVVRNAPSVAGLIVRQRPLVGFPVVPLLTTEFTSAPHALPRWRVSLTVPQDASVAVAGADAAGAEGGAGEDKGAVEDEVEWEEADGMEGTFLVPRAEHQGKLISVEMTPVRGKPGEKAHGVVGVPVTYQVQVPVGAAPDMSAHQERWDHAAATRPGGAGSKPGGIRVLSYNILADNYASTPFARESLYHYCPDEFLSVDFRKQLAVQEIIAYRPDVACLQEVTEDVFLTWLQPVLDAQGFEGRYTQKTGNSAIGCATFVRRSRWHVKATHAVDLASEWKECPDLAEMVNGPSDVAGRLKRGLERSTTVAQVERLAKQKPAPDGSEPGIILCGDFNSLPEEGVCADLSVRPMLVQACRDTPTTYCTDTTQQVVDYIYFSGGTLKEDEDVGRFPDYPLSALTADGGLPSRCFPSDHVVLVQDLVWL
ncbi:Endonuclease/exonuclease/phosphatase [Baffinella frigidus]|nr:Endonuclease/exonuclease/phosphatase [Cryptophyta sp. CCMP2293]